MSFLRDYIKFTSGNEAPAIFHTWSGISALSSLCSFKIWTDQGAFIVRPQLYVMLVGNPGIKKSTAMSFARRYIKQFKTIPIAPSAITKEALTQFMAEKGSPCKKVIIVNGHPVNYSHISIFSNELVSLLNAGGNPVGMIEFLTDVWDQADVGFEVKTKNKGTDSVEGPFITILGCMTPEVMENLTFQRIISGGFTRRCIFVHADRNEKPVPRPELTDEQKAAWDRMIETGARISQLQGKFEWTPEAIAVHDEWYDKNFYKRETTTDDKVMQGYFNSKGEFVIKVAMLLAVSETEELIFLPQHIQAALAFLEQVEPGIKRIFSGSGRNELGQIQASIESMVEGSREPINVKRIYNEFRNQASLQELAGIIMHLQKAGIVELFQVNLKNGVPPAEFIGRPGSADEFRKGQNPPQT